MAKKNDNPKSITYTRDSIVIHRLRKDSPGLFYTGLRKIRGNDVKTVRVTMAKSLSTYPNWFLPIVCISEYYRTKLGLSITCDDRRWNIYNPKEESPGNNVLNRIWQFTDTTDVCSLVNAYRCELEKSIQCARGVLNTLEWALNEVMDNVIQHSGVGVGYVMAQVHKDNESIAICVFDYGQGIKASFGTSSSHPKINTDAKAIEYALEEGVTRDKNIGQGNGLYGLKSIIMEGRGRLIVRSGSGCCSIFPEESEIPILEERQQYPDTNAKSTLVDFQLQKNNVLVLENIQMFRDKDYRVVDLYLERFENDTIEGYTYKILSESEGTGTRLAGSKARNQVINIIRNTPDKPVINIDFSGVGVISSSYADELVVKLALELGLFQFNNVIRLTNMTKEHQAILHRSFSQRIKNEQNLQEIETTDGSLTTRWIAYIKRLTTRLKMIW